MKILLLGRNGQVGWELQRSLAPLGSLVALDLDSTPAADFGDPGSLAALVRATAPDLVVNAAAHTAVDRAEAEPELALRINAEAVGVLAREAKASGAWLVHYSTDYVFDGGGDSPRDEDAAPAPLSVYGSSKLEGERRIRDSGCLHLILRTSWVYASRGENFAKTMLKLAAERDSLAVIDDQVGAPTGAELLADVTAHVCRAAADRPELAGTYHVAAAGETSWHGYALHILEFAARHGRSLRVRPDGVKAIPSSAFRQAARRPLNSRLDTSRLRRTFGLTLPPWQSGVDRMLTELLA